MPPCQLSFDSTVPQLTTSYERDGFDGTRGDSVWWFEAWGSGPKKSWTTRAEAGRPPQPSELRSADYIVIGIRHASGETLYRTHTGGLDLDPRLNKRRKQRGRGR